MLSPEFSPELSAPVLLEEQSLRDGLQSEARLFSLAERLEIAGLLVTAGFRRVQIGSFVDPRRVPQMTRIEELAERVRTAWPEQVWSALVLNAKGLDRAMRCGLRHLSLSVSVADAHSRTNAGCTAAEALDTMVALMRQAVAWGITIRAGVQCAFGCAAEGDVATATVLHAVRRLIAAGAAEINLADTAGLASPFEVKRLVARVRETVPEVVLSLHLHATGELGLANLLAGYEAGVRTFDVATGGLGGCPFLKGAAGNVAAEDAVRLFERRGVVTGIDRHHLATVIRRYEHLLGRELPGRMRRAPAAAGQEPPLDRAKKTGNSVFL